MGKGTKAPPPPDPGQTAEAQAEANRVSVVSPYGNQMYGNFVENNRPQDMVESDWNALPFDQRYRFEVDPNHAVTQVQETQGQRDFREGSEGVAIDLMRRGGDQLSNLPTDPGISLPSLNGGQDIKAGDLRYGVDASGMGDYSRGVGFTDPVGEYQRRVDTRGLQQLPGVNDLGGEAQRASDAVFGGSMMYLRPEMDLQRARIEQRLADQGIPVGSEAYTAEMDRLGRQQDQQTTALALGSVGAGGAEQSRLTDMALALRGQGYGERVTDANLTNQARAARAGEEFQNVATSNDVRSSLFGEGVTNANLNNAAVAQDFNQEMAKAQLENQVAQMNLGNQVQDRNMRFNELAALLGGPQIGSPTMMQPTPIDVVSPTMAAYNAQVSNAQNAQAGQNAGLGAVASIGGSLIMCFAPGTMIDTPDEPVAIENLRPGDAVKGGAVRAVIEAAAAGQPMMRYRGVHVAPNHAVMHDGRWTLVEDTDEAVEAEGVDTVYTLLTTSGRIWIDGLEFEDQEPLATMVPAAYEAVRAASLEVMNAA